MCDFRYTFADYDGGRGKTTCPSCGKKGVFKKLVDTETNEILSDEFGKCDREVHCSYQNFPSQDNPAKTTGKKAPIKPKTKDKYHTIPKEIFERSFENQFQDNLSTKLIRVAGKSAIKAISDYKIGYSKYFNDYSTIFWQIDTSGKVRTGKIMKYGLDGKRTKNTSWVHAFFSGDYLLEQVFFGAHLIKKDKVIRVVESEKTAIAISTLDKSSIWLASGMLHGLSDYKLNDIKNHEVVLYPDKGKAYDIWCKRIEEFPNENWKVSDVLEKNEKLKEGDDLADDLFGF